MLKAFMREAFFFPMTLEELRRPRVVRAKLLAAGLFGGVAAILGLLLPDDDGGIAAAVTVLMALSGLASFVMGTAAVQIAADRRALVRGSFFCWLNAQISRLVFWNRTECPGCGRRAPYGIRRDASGQPHYTCRLCSSEWGVTDDGKKRMTKPMGPTPDDCGPVTAELPLLDRVARFLDANDLHYDLRREDGVIALQLGISNASMRLFIAVQAVGDWQRLGIQGLLPVRVPAHRHAAALDAVNRINHSLAVGNLEIDMRDGSVNVRTSVESDRDIPDAMLGRLFEKNVAIADRYFAPLMAVAFGGADAGSVLEADRQAETMLH